MITDINYITPNLYNELSKFYKLATQDTLIFRKKYERVNYIIKLLKDKNINVKDYKKEAIKVLLTPNIKNYSMYIDNFYYKYESYCKKMFKLQ